MATRLAQITAHLGPQKKSKSSAVGFRYDAHAEVFPTRKELPEIPGAPPGAAWFWGENDELGRLNLLTPERVLAASKEIKTGEVVPLNLTLGEPSPPCFSRQQFVHTIKMLGPDGHAFDDFYDMNTQAGSQWDGFRHFAHQETGVFYNNTKASDIVGPTCNTRCGIQAWARKGIVGLGILLDFATWATQTSHSYDVFSPSSAITLSTLLAVGLWQGIDIRPVSQGGDIPPGCILLVRTGFLLHNHSPHDNPPNHSHDHSHNHNDHSVSPNEREHEHARPPTEQAGEYEQYTYIGLDQSEEMLDWLHDCYFAGVASDCPALEAWPSRQNYYLHEYLLARWGVPLGELWDLERLAEVCAGEGRWRFLLTSAPANVEGGVATMPNALAVF